MIIVTGSARTGTSLMMQTLMILGYKGLAEKFTEAHNKIKSYNPKGFYELEIEEIKKLNVNDRDTAVKVFGGCLPFVEPNQIDKMIVMKRNKKDAVKSSVPVFELLGYAHDYMTTLSYDMNYAIIDKYMKRFSSIIINFEDITFSPEKDIRRLVEFLQLNVSQERIKLAINNIKNN
jgi:hypothetical protein